MMCQHCETAPCEYVCPVNATVHSPDGLNEMVYNRCVGTRSCSNNCPYKVHRFNWFKWQTREPINRGLVELQRNPEVTVRDRGVMEKCTYCVQRIRNAEIEAELERRALRSGEVKTACQQTCPTGAIAFGSLRHHETEMVRRRSEPRAYQVLHDQGTRPRTVYMARLRNPNPELSSVDFATLRAPGEPGWVQEEGP
jgi:Fe-S-cluster-containing dehydrogenase component